jgi:hypothetical protein
MNGKGIGEPLILTFLHGVPGINASTIKDQLASLKSSGHYAPLTLAANQNASCAMLRIKHGATAA